jgi:hypothetical protein
MNENTMSLNVPVYETEKEFLVLQFQALREEILALKVRVMRIQTMGLTGIPVLIGLAVKYDIPEVLYVGPLLTIVVCLMILCEQCSIMRAGNYIRNHIEPYFLPEDMVGWEKYLEGEKQRRAEKYFRFSTLLLYLLYWLGGTILALKELSERHIIEYVIAAIVIYIVAFGFGVYYYLNFKVRQRI